MRVFIDSVLLFLLALSIIQFNWIFIALFGAGLTYRGNALWILPLALSIDGYFGAFNSFPVLSLIAVAWYFVTETLRSRLLVQYNYE